MGLKGKLRPLVCGSTFRRLVMSALCSERSKRFAEYLGKEQFAVGVEASIEKLAYSMRALHTKYPNATTLQFDAVSAFNNIFREEMLAELADCDEGIVAFFALFMTEPSELLLVLETGHVASFLTSVGIDQGCPGSVIAFAL